MGQSPGLKKWRDFRRSSEQNFLRFRTLSELAEINTTSSHNANFPMAIEVRIVKLPHLAFVFVYM